MTEDSGSTDQPFSETESEIIQLRRAKLARWREQGQAFPNDYRRKHLASELMVAHGDASKEELEASAAETSVSGRIMLRRVMGKASFITLQDVSGRIQAYIRQSDVGEAAYEDFNTWDIGDIVAVTGTMMKTNKGELSVKATAIRLLTKSLRPLPEKHAGLTDVEARYRQRYVDLIMNDETRQVFINRGKIIDHIRRYFIDHDFMEVETPMMLSTPGGATAAPFMTHYNALDTDMYLRVAPELNLKRLVVGGFERVFEINRNFRNEGVDTTHSPEFTMLEFYWAYADYNDLMDLTEELFRGVAKAVLGTEKFVYQNTEIDFGQPFARQTMAEAILEHNAHVAVDQLEDITKARALAKASGVEVNNAWGLGKVVMEIFDVLVEDKITQPVFITQHPTEVSPLARRNEQDPEITDRFELFCMGQEIANGFSELNDSEDQAERFRQQVEAKDAGDDEAMHFDHDYITALEYGLPPTAGEGIGIDRLVMLLTDRSSIRDVVLFPHMRPKKKAETGAFMAEIKLEPGWLRHLQQEFDQSYMIELKDFLQAEKQRGKVVYPPGSEIFNALNLTPPEQVKVVVLGQDPYHGPGQAHGLCFSVSEGVAPPPSLRNIFKEICSDLNVEHDFPHGNLTTWAKQGVLLLNSVLTVERQSAASHQGKGWEQFTDKVIEVLSTERENCVFMLWGSYAQKKGQVIDTGRHLVLKAPHPSPLSAHRGFLGCRHFSQCNNYLTQTDQRPIDWLY